MNVTIYESTSLIGGNCKTIIDGEFRYDTGAHRLHDKDSTVTNEIKSLLGDSLLKVSSPSKIYFEGRSFNFPINIKDIIFKFDLKTLSKILVENIWTRLRKQEVRNILRTLPIVVTEKLSLICFLSHTLKNYGVKKLTC